MEHVVRKVSSSDGKKILGYGVFYKYQVENIPEDVSININACLSGRDARERYQTYRLIGLYPKPRGAESRARQLTTAW